MQHVTKVYFNEAVENFRNSQLEALEFDHKKDLKLMDNLQAYAYDLQSFAQDLMKLVEVAPDVRFTNLRKMCRDGCTATFFPDVVDDIDINNLTEVYVLVFDEKNELMGTLTRKDLNY